MEFKQLSHGIKDLDDSKGVVVAYANVYGNVDSDGDVSAKGSFTKTVQEQKKKIRVLKDHNTHISLGVPLALDASDSYGLLTTTQFNLEKEVGRDMYTDIKLYQANDLDSDLSIGFKIVKRDEKDQSIINEYKLYEYSFLTSWGANELATVQGIKSIRKVEGFIELLNKAYNLDYSDSRLIKIESILKSLTKEPFSDTPEIADVNLVDLYKSLIIK